MSSSCETRGLWHSSLALMASPSRLASRLEYSRSWCPPFILRVHRHWSFSDMRLLVLGAGLQGSACAYDLLQNPDVEQVRLADISIEHVRDFLGPYSGKRLIPTPLDVRNTEAVRALMTECDAVMSAIPYYFNFELAKHAVECKAHFCDLGGNTPIVFQQKELEPQAKANG